MDVASIAVLAFVCGICAGAFALRVWQRAKLIELTPRMNLFESRREMLRHATRRPSVIMLGDSITAGVPWTEVAEHPGVSNFGRDGDTVAGVLYRLDEVLMLRPKAVFLMIGANDVNARKPPAEIANAIRVIVDRLSSADINVVVHPILPMRGGEDYVTTANRAIADALQDAKAVTVPLSIGVEDLRDGLHLEPSGFLKWHETIRPMLLAYSQSSAEARP
jgi:hypothetical protein